MKKKKNPFNIRNSLKGVTKSQATYVTPKRENLNQYSDNVADKSKDYEEDSEEYKKGKSIKYKNNKMEQNFKNTRGDVIRSSSVPLSKKVSANISTVENKRIVSKSLINNKEKAEINYVENLSSETVKDERRVIVSRLNYSNKTNQKSEKDIGNKKPRYIQKAEKLKKVAESKKTIDIRMKKITARKNGMSDSASQMIIGGSIAAMITTSDDTTLQGSRRVASLYKNTKRVTKYSTASAGYAKQAAVYSVRFIKAIGSDFIKVITSKFLLAALPTLVIGIVAVLPVILGMGAIGSLFGWLLSDDINTEAQTLTNYQMIIDNQIRYDTLLIDELVNPSDHGNGDDYGEFKASSDTDIDVNYKEVLSVLIAIKVKLYENDDTVNLLEFETSEILDTLTHFYTWDYETTDPYYCTAHGDTCYCPGHTGGHNSSCYIETSFGPVLNCTDDHTYYHSEGCTCDGHHKKYTIDLMNDSMENVMTSFGFELDDINKATLVLNELDNIIAVNIPSTVDTYTVNGLGWAFPLPTVSGWYITSPYGVRNDPITNVVTFHSGTDLAASGIEGQPIMSVLNDGTVTAQGYNSIRGNYAEVAYIHNGINYTVTYMHMIACKVKIGDTVNQGDVLGGVGSTGKSTGAHLHIGIERNSYFNPWTVIEPSL